VAEGRRLTRRDALSGAAAVGAGALLGPAAAAHAAGAQGGMPAVGAHSGGRVFARHLGGLAAGEVRTVGLRAPVCLAAVRWKGPVDAVLTLRSRRADGRWGPWAIASTAGHDGDGVRTPERVGEGVWVGRATELQVHAGHGARDVTVLLVAAEPHPGRGHGDPGAAAHPDAVARPDAAAHPDAVARPDAAAHAALPLAGPRLPAGPGAPPIIARAAWAGRNHRPVGGPYYGGIEMGIVHHTENPNGYSPGEVPAMLRAIYAFHVHGRGWFDIGYNFVIDRFGRIWEARQGGIDLPVIGAQAGDWNEISVGVSLLGTYTSVVPSPAAMAALERLLAWKLALNGLPAVGEISAVASGSDISYTRFHAGQHVRFPRIAGHRQVDTTDCPGGALFGRLGAMRPRVQALLGAEARIVLSGQIDLLADGPVVFGSGVLTQQGAPLAAAPVELQAVVGRAGATRTLFTLATAADGSFQFSLPARAGLLVRAVRTTAPAAVSNVLGVESLRAATG
jgi:hypothetical protein